MPLATQVVRMSREYDPRSVIIQQIEDTAKSTLKVRGREFALNVDMHGVDRVQPLITHLGIEITGPDILLAVYDRSGQYSAGKILVPPAYMEDKIQGKVAMVMGIGPLCELNETDPNARDHAEYMNWFRGRPPRVGDWWVTSIRDGLTFLVGDVVMKLVEWRYLRMRTAEPDLVM